MTVDLTRADDRMGCRPGLRSKNSTWKEPLGEPEGACQVGALARLSPDLNRPEDGSCLAMAKASVPWRDDAVD
jgi:hypothetical protein